MDRRQALIQRIHAAFPDPPYRPLRPDEVLSGDGDERYIQEHYFGKRWTEITPEEVDYMAVDFHAFLRWTDELNLDYFFLPAFLVQAMAQPEEESVTLGSIGNYIVHGIKDVAPLLTPEQQRVLAEVFYEHFGDDPWLTQFFEELGHKPSAIE